MAGDARIVAFSSDLMDRSRLQAAGAGIEFATDSRAAAGAEVVVIDLARFGSLVAAARASAPAARIVGYGPHVETDAARAALAAGADEVMARSRFFRDVRAALAGDAGGAGSRADDRSGPGDEPRRSV